MVEELLEFLVGIVDEELFVAVRLKDLETSDIQHADEGRLRRRTVQRAVDAIHKKAERLLVQRLAQSSEFLHGLLLRPGLGDPFTSCQYARPEYRFRELRNGNAEQMASAFGLGGVRHESIVRTCRRNYDVTYVKNCRHNPEKVKLLNRRKSYDVQGILSRI